MEILCTLSFFAAMVLLLGNVWLIAHLRAERRRRVEADEALLKMLSGIGEQFSSMLGALAVAGVIERSGNVAKGVSILHRANLRPDELAMVDAFAKEHGMTREEAVLYLMQQGFGGAVGRPIADDRKDDAHCKGLLCTGDVTCTCMCPGCRRAGRAS